MKSPTAQKLTPNAAGLYGVLADILSLSSCFEFIFFS
ncbi:BnaCnng64050D [Brassica napus]|uniref:BnaCnng64050D protein n=1 Tax=Brassica napus TaxID=3708 RepID=A0A078JRT6_BRANA|nr:BnaCnng64050D [Brassica napus]